MKAYFGEVLAQETTALGAVSDAAHLDGWRRRLIDQVATSQSPYAKVVRHEGDPWDRAVFLDRWRDLIAASLTRVLDSDPVARDRIDPHQVAVSILAALYGGAILCRVAKDTAPLSVSVDLALAPLLQLCTRRQS